MQLAAGGLVNRRRVASQDRKVAGMWRFCLSWTERVLFFLAQGMSYHKKLTIRFSVTSSSVQSSPGPPMDCSPDGE